jgi:hypothetical protein
MAALEADEYVIIFRENESTIFCGGAPAGLCEGRQLHREQP